MSKLDLANMQAAGNYVKSLQGSLSQEIDGLIAKANSIAGRCEKVVGWNNAYVAGAGSKFETRGKSKPDERGFYQLLNQEYRQRWIIKDPGNVGQIKSFVTAVQGKYRQISASLGAIAGQIQGNYEQALAKYGAMGFALSNDDFDKYFRDNIFYNKYNALSGDPRANVTDRTAPYWGTDGNKTMYYQKQDNGTYLILKGAPTLEAGGIPMGFTTAAAIGAYYNYRQQAQQKEAQKYETWQALHSSGATAAKTEDHDKKSKETNTVKGDGTVLTSGSNKDYKKSNDLNEIKQAGESGKLRQATIPYTEEMHDRLNQNKTITFDSNVSSNNLKNTTWAYNAAKSKYYKIQDGATKLSGKGGASYTKAEMDKVISEQYKDRTYTEHYVATDK